MNFEEWLDNYYLFATTTSRAPMYYSSYAWYVTSPEAFSAAITVLQNQFNTCFLDQITDITTKLFSWFSLFQQRIGIERDDTRFISLTIRSQYDSINVRNWTPEQFDYMRDEAVYPYNNKWRISRTDFIAVRGLELFLGIEQDYFYPTIMFIDISETYYDLERFIVDYDLDWPNTASRRTTQANNHLLFDHSFLDFEQAEWLDMKNELWDNKEIEGELTTGLFLELLNTGLEK